MTENIIYSITLPHEIFITDKFLPQRINIIYGRNGTGKTTIARLFYHTDNFTFNKTSAANCEFYIFDKLFIENNIQNYQGMPGIVTVSTQDAELLRELNELKGQLHGKETDMQLLTDTLKALDNELSVLEEYFREICWKKTTELRKEFEKTLSGKKTKQKFAEACVCTSPQKHDEAKLSQLYDSAFVSAIKPFPFYCTIQNTMVLDSMSGTGLLGTPLLGSGDSLFSDFMKKIHAVDWVKSGHTNLSHIAGKICPYCQQALPDDFDEQLAACFDDEYKRSLDSLQKFLEQYRRSANDMFIPLQNNLKETMRFDNADHTALISLMKLLKQIISTNIERIRKKIESPSSVVELETTHELMKQINTEISAINTAISDHNRMIDDIKGVQETCKAQVMEYIAYCLQNEIREYRTKKEQLSYKKHSCTEKLKKLKEAHMMISDQLSQIDDRITNTAEAVSHINALLAEAGFNGFSLRQSTRYDHTYEVLRENGELVSQLSEGEQRFLAFLYFYHLLGSESRENKKRIAVIDDPFTGLDRETTNIVTAMLKDLILPASHDAAAQLFLMTHRRDLYSVLADSLNNSDDSSAQWILNKSSGRTLIEQDIQSTELELDETDSIF